MGIYGQNFKPGRAPPGDPLNVTNGSRLNEAMLDIAACLPWRNHSACRILPRHPCRGVRRMRLTIPVYAALFRRLFVQPWPIIDVLMQSKFL